MTATSSEIRTVGAVGGHTNMPASGPTTVTSLLPILPYTCPAMSEVEQVVCGCSTLAHRPPPPPLHPLNARVTAWLWMPRDQASGGCPPPSPTWGGRMPALKQAPAVFFKLAPPPLPPPPPPSPTESQFTVPLPHSCADRGVANRSLYPSLCPGDLAGRPSSCQVWASSRGRSLGTPSPLPQPNPPPPLHPHPQAQAPAPSPPPSAAIMILRTRYTCAC